MKKIEHKDPLALDLLAARDDRARIFFDYGRTEAIALKKGGKFLAAKRAQHMKRVVDVLRECEALDKVPPPNACRLVFNVKVFRRV